MILTCYRHGRPRVRRTAHRSDIVGNTLNHVSFVGGYIRYILYTRYMPVPHYLCADSVLWCVSSEIAGDHTESCRLPMTPCALWDLFLSSLPTSQLNPGWQGAPQAAWVGHVGNRHNMCVSDMRVSNRLPIPHCFERPAML